VSDKFGNNPFWLLVNRIRVFYADRQLNYEEISKEATHVIKRPAGGIDAVKERLGTHHGTGKTGNRKLKKKVQYKRENLLKARIFSYVNPYRLETVNKHASWYEEYKIVETKRFSIIALVDGWKVEYQVQVYDFHKVLDTAHKKARLINHIRNNPKGTYKGWIHHVNYYGGISKNFKEQEILNFHL